MRLVARRGSEGIDPRLTERVVAHGRKSSRVERGNGEPRGGGDEGETVRVEATVDLRPRTLLEDDGCWSETNESSYSA